MRRILTGIRDDNGGILNKNSNWAEVTEFAGKHAVFIGRRSFVPLAGYGILVNNLESSMSTIETGKKKEEKSLGKFLMLFEKQRGRDSFRR